MARSAAVACAEMPSHSCGPGNIGIRVRVRFTTGAVWSAILATAGLLVLPFLYCLTREVPDKIQKSRKTIVCVRYCTTWCITNPQQMEPVKIEQ